MEFINRTLVSGDVSARKLCTAFIPRLPGWLRDPSCPEEQIFALLGRLIERELAKRQRLPQFSTIDHVVDLLKRSSNIMVVTGAGISTSLGIPDFRSKDTGFYAQLSNHGYEHPEEVFTLENFDEDPRIFFSLAGEILPDLNRWTPTHQFIRLLQDKEKLLRVYTQNIDNIEANAGIRPDRLIQCHGSWATATCRKCGYHTNGSFLFPFVKAKQVAECPRCIETIKAQSASSDGTKPSLKRKRSATSNPKKKSRRGYGDGDASDSASDGCYDVPTPGVMKPDITFFGEQLPSTFFDQLHETDRDAVDLVLVIGTSMKVAPVSEIPNFVPDSVPCVYIDMGQCQHLNFDVTLMGECDAVVAELARRAGWDLEHSMLPKEGGECDILPVEDRDGTVLVHTHRVVRKSHVSTVDREKLKMDLNTDLAKVTPTTSK